MSPPPPIQAFQSSGIQAFMSSACQARGSVLAGYASAWLLTDSAEVLAFFDSGGTLDFCAASGTKCWVARNAASGITMWLLDTDANVLATAEIPNIYSIAYNGTHCYVAKNSGTDHKELVVLDNDGEEVSSLDIHRHTHTEGYETTETQTITTDYNVYLSTFSLTDPDYQENDEVNYFKFNGTTIYSDLTYPYDYKTLNVTKYDLQSDGTAFDYTDSSSNSLVDKTKMHWPDMDDGNIKGVAWNGTDFLAVGSITSKFEEAEPDYVHKNNAYKNANTGLLLGDTQAESSTVASTSYVSEYSRNDVYTVISGGYYSPGGVWTDWHYCEDLFFDGTQYGSGVKPAAGGGAIAYEDCDSPVFSRQYGVSWSVKTTSNYDVTTIEVARDTGSDLYCVAADGSIVWVGGGEYSQTLYKANTDFVLSDTISDAPCHALSAGSEGVSGLRRLWDLVRVGYVWTHVLDEEYLMVLDTDGNTLLNVELGHKSTYGRTGFQGYGTYLDGEYVWLVSQVKLVSGNYVSLRRYDFYGVVDVTWAPSAGGHLRGVSKNNDGLWVCGARVFFTP